MAAVDKLGLPASRPMPAIGARCHELRVADQEPTWQIVYYIAMDAIVVPDVFSKETQATPAGVLQTCRQQLARFIRASEERE